MLNAVGAAIGTVGRCACSTLTGQNVWSGDLVLMDDDDEQQVLMRDERLSCLSLFLLRGRSGPR